MTPALLSSLILGGALLLFVSERVRHDLVALIALFACLAAGLVSPERAFGGFADPAVLAVAGILIVGRAVELSGVAAALAGILIPERAGFAVRLALLLAVAMLLSAFMNNIAALVITMPIATEIARSAKLPPTVTLMPLAFATILGGMTTLIGTPANLILSSVRADVLGAPLGFFAMAPVGVAVCAIGLAYLALAGWRLLPLRESQERAARPPWRVFELVVPADPPAALLSALRNSKARLLRAFRKGDPVAADTVGPGDHLLLLSRANQWAVAEMAGLEPTALPGPVGDEVTARVVVAHGSPLIGLGYEAIRTRSADRIEVVAVGPRVARERQPLMRMLIHAGDQLFLRGRKSDLAAFVPGARMLEIDRFDPAPLAPLRAGIIVAIFAAAIGAIVLAEVSPAVAFVGAAVLLGGARLLPPSEVYRSIDWTVIVLLAAMIPVGQSFNDSGAAAIVAHWLGAALAGMPLTAVLAALCAVTLLLSIFLNNVATAVIMGPLAIDVARMLGVSPDAALLAVLIGASSDFLTPIGHQNNLLVMGPGGYRFTDYARMGALLVVAVVATAALTLGWLYG